MTHLTRFAGIFLCLIGCLAFAQVPQSFSYQAVCRNTNGSPLLNQPVHFNIELLQGSITGTVVYAETQRDTTSAFGVSMLEIGRGTPTTGTFAGINWANTPTFIRISFDATGGNNFIPLGTHELLSVPYALYSGNGLPNGTSPNQLLYWNGTAWVQLAPGNSGESLTLCGNTLTWATGGVCGIITGLSCSTSVNTGSLVQGVSASSVSSTISYSGGNLGPHGGQTVASSGVTGLTATLSPGSFASGNGTLVYTISGTPGASGTASFAINIGGESCTLNRTVTAPIGSWRPGMVHCSAPTQVVPVTNPTTNKTWMDRNLGASQVATSSTDANAYGDLYQWGRFGDGHQCRNSGTTAILSSNDSPGTGLFILSLDWRNPPNANLWQGINGVNNPCPVGYRLPTDSELDAERLSWTNNNVAGAFLSVLKLPLGGLRDEFNFISSAGTYIFCWSSSISGSQSSCLRIGGVPAQIFPMDRGYGSSVRCIQD